MKYRPLNDWVLVRPEPAEEKTQGGIVIPDSAQEKPVRGEVLAVGRGHVEEQRDKQGRLTGEKKFIETEVKRGDQVAFRRFGVDDVTVEGEELLMIREREILGVY